MHRATIGTTGGGSADRRGRAALLTRYKSEKSPQSISNALEAI